MARTSNDDERGSRPTKVLPDKNKIVQWRGGGWAGCIWQPETGFFDETGNWHPVISSGYGKRDTLDEFNAKRLPETRDWQVSRNGSDADLVYPITRKGLLEFQENIRDDFFMATLKAVEAAGYLVFWRCTQCKKVKEGTDLFADFEGYKGDGGIGVIYQGMICQECWDTGTCTECNTFGSKADLVQLSGGQYCKGCIAQAVEDRATDKERAALESLDQDLDRFQYQVDEYCRLVPHAAGRAREQAEQARNRLERQREKLLDVIVGRPR